MGYKSETSLACRQQEYRKVMKGKSENFVPVIVEIPGMARKKFVIARTMTFGEMLVFLRRSCSLRPDQGFFPIVDDKAIPVATESMEQIYAKHYDREDNFLYVTIKQESTFGGSHSFTTMMRL